MAKKIVKAQMMQRRDIALQWSIKNPVLLDGELGIIKDQPGSYKVGDGVTAWNDLPLRGFDGNIVHTTGDSETAVMSQKGVTEVTDLLGKRIAESTAELAQLSQEFEELKEAEFTVIVEPIPHIEKVVVTDGGAVLQPDKLYDFGESAQIAVAFAPATDPKYAAQYAFQFKSPADTPTTLTMPEGVVFPVESDSQLQIKKGLTYQITIVDNLAVATSWEV